MLSCVKKAWDVSFYKEPLLPFFRPKSGEGSGVLESSLVCDMARSGLHLHHRAPCEPPSSPVKMEMITSNSQGLGGD